MLGKRNGQPGKDAGSNGIVALAPRGSSSSKRHGLELLHVRQGNSKLEGYTQLFRKLPARFKCTNFGKTELKQPQLNWINQTNNLINNA